MKVRIFDLVHGLKEYNNINFIRIVSDDYSLIIVNDYKPVYGEVNGTITFNSNEIDLEYNKIKADYVYRNNEFNLVIRE